MTRDEREVLSQRICKFYCDSVNKSVKTTVNYFVKQNIPRIIVYYTLNKYLKYGSTNPCQVYTLATRVFTPLHYEEHV